jgi:hypothetical protein
MPGCYAFLKEHDPKGAIVEIPHLGSGGSHLNASCTYWQALHRLNTSAGYSGHANVIEDARVGHNSPFQAGRLAQPDYLEDPGRVNLDVNAHVDFRDYLWLYLTVNRFDYIVLHQWPGAVPEHPVRLDRLKALLRDYTIYEDSDSVVYARTLIRPPARPASICLEDWRLRHLWEGRYNCLLRGAARVVVYNPDPARELTMVLDTATWHPDQSVCLRAGDRVLARWDFEPRRYQNCVSPPFRLPVGMSTLTIESESRRTPGDPKAGPGKRKRSDRLLVARVSLYPVQAPSNASIAAWDQKSTSQSAPEADQVTREE